MPYAVGDLVVIKISLSLTVLKGSTGVVTAVVAGNLYDVFFDEKPDGNPIHPPSAETVAEKNLDPTTTGVSALTVGYAVGDRVKIKISLSPQVQKGSKGNVTGVLAGNLYDVLFDEDPAGGPINPASPETVAERNLEPGK